MTRRDTSESQLVLKRSLHLGLGRLAALQGANEAARIMSVSRSKAAYWRKKYENPTWKKNSHGGAGRKGFDLESKSKMVNVIIYLVDTRPTSRYRDYMKAIYDTLGIKVSETYVASLIKALGYTYETSFVS